MPTSNLAGAPAIIELITEAQPRTVLDVGPGLGKYGLLVREYIACVQLVDAVEAEPSYITERLRAIYDSIAVMDVREMTDQSLASYDLVLMGDVIEHIPREDALALLRRIPGHVVIATPRDFFTQHVEGVPSEDHVSHWAVEDFEATGRLARVHPAGIPIAGIIVRLAPL